MGGHCTFYLNAYPDEITQYVNLYAETPDSAKPELCWLYRLVNTRLGNKITYIPKGPCLTLCALVVLVLHASTMAKASLNSQHWSPPVNSLGVAPSLATETSAWPLLKK